MLGHVPKVLEDERFGIGPATVRANGAPTGDHPADHVSLPTAGGVNKELVAAWNQFGDRRKGNFQRPRDQFRRFIENRGESWPLQRVTAQFSDGRLLAHLHLVHPFAAAAFGNVTRIDHEADDWKILRRTRGNAFKQTPRAVPMAKTRFGNVRTVNRLQQCP